MAGRNPEPVGGMAEAGRWTTTTWIPEVGEALKAHTDQIERQLKLEKRAAEDGENMLPPQNDTMLNKPQSEVCQRIFEGILLLNRFLHEQIDTALSRARALFSEGVEDAAGLEQDISTSVGKIFSEHRDELFEIREKDLRASRGLRKFKSDNKLGRDAHYKESPSLVFGILLGLLLGESVLNGALLSAVMQGGVVQGVAVALMISGLNILLGLCAGLYGWRLLGHRQPALKALGAAIAVLCHVSAIAWNLFIGHFREVAEGIASNPNANLDVSQLGADTLHHISAYGLFGMSTVQSWALLLLGIFIHFYAAKEGWDDVADRYFDYKKYHARAEAAHRDYTEKLEQIRSEAVDEVEAVEQRVKSAAKLARRDAEAIANLLDVAIQRRQEVKDSEDEWVAAGTRLLKIYRDKNTEIRDEGSEPAYFSVYPSAQDYRNRTFGGLPPSTEIVERYRDISQQIESLKDFARDAKTNWEKSESLAGEAARHARLTIARLDEEMKKVDRDTTRAVRKKIEEDDQDIASALRPANDGRVERAA